MRQSRRQAIAGFAAVAGGVPAFAEENEFRKVGSERPGNNYYFPMARYRYAPRILRAWIAVDELGTPALKDGDWEGVQIVTDRLEDATTAMPLFTSSVEGARSTKRKKKSETQKSMAKATERYAKACADLQKAVTRKDETLVLSAFAEAKDALATYRKLAKIDGPDGGMVVPENTAEGRGGVPDAQYVVPVFTGGGAMSRDDVSSRIHALPTPGIPEPVPLSTERGLRRSQLSAEERALPLTNYSRLTQLAVCPISPDSSRRCVRSSRRGQEWTDRLIRLRPRL